MVEAAAKLDSFPLLEYQGGFTGVSQRRMDDRGRIALPSEMKWNDSAVVKENREDSPFQTLTPFLSNAGGQTLPVVYMFPRGVLQRFFRRYPEGMTRYPDVKMDQHHRVILIDDIRKRVGGVGQKFLAGIGPYIMIVDDTDAGRELLNTAVLDDETLRELLDESIAAQIFSRGTTVKDASFYAGTPTVSDLVAGVQGALKTVLSVPGKTVGITLDDVNFGGVHVSGKLTISVE